MEITSIDYYVQPRILENIVVNIHFKGRSSVVGLFIRCSDYDELKSKNFWRVVHLSQLEKWFETNDMNLARIFNGASFSSLSEIKPQVKL